MSKKMPSLAALLGLVAIAGYQNRDKISEYFKGLTGKDPAVAAGDAVDKVKGMLGDGPLSTQISGGLGELVDRFKTAGHGEAADSWVSTGPNKPITETHLEKALGGDLIDTLVKQTGLTREDLLARLSKVLPDAVDVMTPEGRIAR
jgi:uncharacterized protein YidB (DUF937 family)